MGLLYNSNQPIVTLEQMAFQRRLYRELKRFADRGVCITLNGQTDVPLQHIANLCIIRQRGMYYAQKEYNADGILTAIHFVLYDRRHRDCVSRVSEPV